MISALAKAQNLKIIFFKIYEIMSLSEAPILDQWNSSGVYFNTNNSSLILVNIIIEII